MSLQFPLVEVWRTPGAVSLRIDGQEFPWPVSIEGISTQVRRDEVPSITLTILADRVEVHDSMVSADA